MSTFGVNSSVEVYSTGSLQITGSVNVTDTNINVTVTNTPNVSISNVSLTVTSSNPLTVVPPSGSFPVAATGSLQVTGSVNITNATINVATGSTPFNVNVTNSLSFAPTGSLLITGSVGLNPSSVSISNSSLNVSVQNASLTVTSSNPITIVPPSGSLPVVATGSLQITGSVNVTNATIAVTTGSIPFNVSVLNSLSFAPTGSLLITGSVGLNPASVSISNTPTVSVQNSSAPLSITGSALIINPSSNPVYSTLLGTLSGSLPIASTGYLQVTGSVNVTNTNLNVSISNALLTVTSSSPISVVPISGTFPVSTSTTGTFGPITGSVNVTNTLLNVSITNTPNVTVSNASLTVTSSNPISVVPISGSFPVAATGSLQITGSVNVTNTLFSVSVTNTPNVTISNALLTVTSSNPITVVPPSGSFPVAATGSLQVTGSVNVTNATIAVTTGSIPFNVSVLNSLSFAPTGSLLITGSVGLNPASVSISNTPTVSVQNSTSPLSITGSTLIINPTTNPVYSTLLGTLSGSLPITTTGSLQITGSVNVTNANINATITNTSLTVTSSNPITVVPPSGSFPVATTGSLQITGSVNVTNATIAVTTGSIPFNVSVLNSLSFAPTGSLLITGSVGLNPASVSITNTPTVSVQNSAAPLSITGSVLIVNPTSNPVYSTLLGTLSGSLPITTTGSLQITGSVNVTNTSITVTQGISASLTSGWPITSGQTTQSTIAWTSASNQDSTLVISVAGYGGVECSYHPTNGTITNGIITFEVSDNNQTTWYPITMGATSGNTAIGTYGLAGSLNAFQMMVAGFTHFRIRLSTTITGSGTANIGATAAAIASDPVPGVTQATTPWIISATGSLPITGSVTLSSPASIAISATGSLQITGSVNITNASIPITTASPLTVTASLANPVYVTGSVSIAPVSGTIAVTVSNTPTVSVQNSSSPLSVTGSVEILNSNVPLSITGSTLIINSTSNPVYSALLGMYTGSLPIASTGSLQVTGSVNVTNSSIAITTASPLTVTASLGNPVYITGSVSIAPVSGTIAVTVSNTPTVSVQNSTAPLSVTGSVEILNSNVPLNITGSTLIINPTTNPVYSAILGMYTGSLPITATGSINTIITNTPLSVTGSVEAILLGMLSGSLPITTTGSAQITGSVNITNATLPQFTTSSVNVRQNTLLSSNNSTTATLTSGSIFSGSGDNVAQYSACVISVYSDQSSVINGLQIQQSQNNTNWDITDSYTYIANTSSNPGQSFSTNIVGQYLRIIYQNGASNQTIFRLQTTYTPIEIAYPRALTQIGNFKVEVQANRAIIHNSSSFTGNGFAIVDGFSSSDAEFLVNIKTAATGTSPTLQYQVIEVDPIDQTTPMGVTGSTQVFTGISSGSISLPSLKSSTLRVQWVVGGTNPGWFGVNASLIGKNIARVGLGGKASYMASTSQLTNGTVSTGIVASVSASIIYLWHPATVTKRYEINRMVVSWGGGASPAATNIPFTINVAKINAVPGSPGGTAVTPVPLGSDSPSLASVVAGATTTPTKIIPDVDLISTSISANDKYIFETPLVGKGYVMEPSVASGYEIRSIVSNIAAPTSGSRIGCSIHWTEE